MVSRSSHIRLPKPVLITLLLPWVLFAAGVAALAGGGAAYASPAVTVSPSSGLTNGQSVTVTGSGFPANDTLAIAECSPLALTVAKADAEGYCDTTTAKVVSASASGAVSSPFAVASGQIGSAAAAICPPVSGSCLIVLSEPSPTSTVRAQTNISFAASTTTTSSSTTSTTRPPSSSSSTTTVISSSSSTSSTTTGSAAVATGSSTGGTSGSSGSSVSDPAALASTGPPTATWWLLGAGLVLADVGYLLVSATWTARKRSLPGSAKGPRG